jgi:hypothetical protein
MSFSLATERMPHLPGPPISVVVSSLRAWPRPDA